MGWVVSCLADLLAPGFAAAEAEGLALRRPDCRRDHVAVYMVQRGGKGILLCAGARHGDHFPEYPVRAHLRALWPEQQADWVFLAGQLLQQVRRGAGTLAFHLPPSQIESRLLPVNAKKRGQTGGMACARHPGSRSSLSIGGTDASQWRNIAG